MSGGGVDADGFVTLPEYDKATYQPQLELVDEANQPVAGATVLFNGVMVTSDTAGKVALPEQKLDEALLIDIEAPDYVPINTRLYFEGAEHTKRLTLTRARTFVLSADTGGRIDLDGASVQLPGGGLIRGDGTVHTGEVRVRAAAADGSKPGADWLTENPAEEKAGGEELSPSGGGVFVTLHDEKGEPLTIAKGDRARVSMPMAADDESTPGDTLPVHTRDSKKGLWVEEGTCTVQVDESLGNKKVCVADVEHFTIYRWSVAKAYCGRYRLRLTKPLPKGIKIAWWYVMPLSLAQWRGDSPKRCFVSALEFRLLSVVLQRSDGSRFTATRPIERGEYSVVKTKSVKVSAKNSDACTQLRCSEFTLDFELGNSDADGDGWADQGDCNYMDKTTFPGAPWNVCDGKDHDCDGKPDGELSKWFANGHRQWNAMCPWIEKDCADQLKTEVPGNDLDEDCDGFISDADNDMYYAKGDPNAPARKAVDCDDNDGKVHSEATEIPGTKDKPNYIDENCDGVLADADGDGVKSAKQLIKESMDLVSDKVDCNDFDPQTYPGADVKDTTVLADGGKYYLGSQRQAAFCELFYGDTGALNPNGQRLLRNADRNCNGVLEDLDGDGLLVAAAGPFNNQGPFDGNDLDPRVKSKGETASGDTACPHEPDLTNFGAGSRRVCPLLFSADQACVEAKNQDGSSANVSVCAAYDYKGFSLPPNPFKTGAQYSPCSEALDCKDPTLQCGGPIKYSDAYLKGLALQQDVTLKDLPKAAFQGICMPRCDDVQ